MREDTRRLSRRGSTSPTTTTAAFAAAGFLLVSVVSAAAFAPSTSSIPSSTIVPSNLALHPRGFRQTPCCSITVQHAAAPTTDRADDIPVSPKLESAAVKRFTTGYDKLCKNCPTRLQPRVDTLTEMILGLSDDERKELMSTVERRIEERREEGAEGRGVKTARELYDYQVGMEGASLLQTAKKTRAKKLDTSGTDDSKPRNSVKREMKKEEADREWSAKRSSIEDLAALEAKLASKLSNSRSKLEKYQLDHSRAARLVTVASLLLSDGPDAPLPPSVIKANDCNAAVDELRCMDQSELELQKLKYDATRAKCERKMAKARVKMFAANLEMSRAHALRVEREKEEQLDEEEEKAVGDATLVGGANKTIVAATL